MTEVVACVARDLGRYLVTQRLATDKYGPSRWEFPGGKVNPGESLFDALRREILEELGAYVYVGAEIYAFTANTSFDQTKLASEFTIHFFDCIIESSIQCLGVQAYRWSSADDLYKLDFLPIDFGVLPALLNSEVLP